MNRPSIVCPVDFSEHSRTALHYAAAIADHFGARLLVVAVNDPLLDSAAQSVGQSLERETEHELQRFVGDVVPNASTLAAMVDTHVSVGKAAPEILRIGTGGHADLIVMSSHGRSGVNKRFFGSTTERVLRETTIPVLVTPREAERVGSVSGLSRHVRRVLVPVDLTATSPHHVKVAAGIAAGLGLPLMLAHVLESVYIPPSVRLAMPGADNESRASAETGLMELIEASGVDASPETFVLTGDPSEEIVRLADTRGAGLIVMGLHSSGLLGPRMGSVTYRILCLTRSLVLALPPLTSAQKAWTSPAEAASAG